jgi:hypothetical protein
MRCVARALVLAGSMTAGAATALAGPTGQEFGQHVACVAQNGDGLGGLSGGRNPGRHQDYGNVADAFMTCHADEDPAGTHSRRYRACGAAPTIIPFLSPLTKDASTRWVFGRGQHRTPEASGRRRRASMIRMHGETGYGRERTEVRRHDGERLQLRGLSAGR